MTAIKNRMGDVEPAKKVVPAAPSANAELVKLPKYDPDTKKLYSKEVQYLCQRFGLDSAIDDFEDQEKNISFRKIKELLKNSPLRYSDSFIDSFFSEFKEAPHPTKELIDHLAKLDDIFHNLAVLSINGKTEAENFREILLLYQKANLDAQYSPKIHISNEDWKHLVTDNELSENEKSMLQNRLNIRADQLEQIIDPKLNSAHMQRQMGLLKLLREGGLAGVQQEGANSYALPYQWLQNLFNHTEALDTLEKLKAYANLPALEYPDSKNPKVTVTVSEIIQEWEKICQEHPFLDPNKLLIKENNTSIYENIKQELFFRKTHTEILQQWKVFPKTNLTLEPAELEKAWEERKIQFQKIPEEVAKRVLEKVLTSEKLWKAFQQKLKLPVSMADAPADFVQDYLISELVKDKKTIQLLSEKSVFFAEFEKQSETQKINILRALLFPAQTMEHTLWGQNNPSISMDFTYNQVVEFIQKKGIASKVTQESFEAALKKMRILQVKKQLKELGITLPKNTEALNELTHLLIQQIPSSVTAEGKMVLDKINFDISGQPMSLPIYAYEVEAYLLEKPHLLTADGNRLFAIEEVGRFKKAKLIQSLEALSHNQTIPERQAQLLRALQKPDGTMAVSEDAQTHYLEKYYSAVQSDYFPAPAGQTSIKRAQVSVEYKNEILFHSAKISLSEAAEYATQLKTWG